MKPRLVIVSSRFPYPLIKGDKLRIYHQIKHLSKEFNICLISINDTEVPEAYRRELEAFCEEIHVFKLPKWKSIASSSLSFKHSYPIQVAYFYSKAIHTELLKIVDNFNADLAYFQLVRTALYSEGLNIPKVLDYMDAFSTIALRDARYSSGIRKAVFKNEAKRLQNFEQKVLDWYDATTIISDNDRQELNIPSIHVITNGVDVNKFKPIDQKQKYDVCFIGNLGYAPNQRALQFMHKKILPGLKFKYPSLKVLIAGARPPLKIKDLANDYIDIKADLLDIREAYASAKVFVAPIFTGAGQQNKILEAMAMGLPCVTSTVVNSSIKANSEEILIGFSAEDFISHTLRLLKDDELYNSYKNAALSFVRTNYSWKIQGDKLSSILHSVLKES
jgi:glycosyltransferase involved in cell wall biosynthesis